MTDTENNLRDRIQVLVAEVELAATQLRLVADRLKKAAQAATEKERGR